MLKQFFSLLKRYILPYRKYLTWALILNFLSQWLNVFFVHGDCANFEHSVQN